MCVCEWGCTILKSTLIFALVVWTFFGYKFQKFGVSTFYISFGPKAAGKFKFQPLRYLDNLKITTLVTDFLFAQFCHFQRAVRCDRIASEQGAICRERDNCYLYCNYCFETSISKNFIVLIVAAIFFLYFSVFVQCILLILNRQVLPFHELLTN